MTLTTENLAPVEALMKALIKADKGHIGFSFNEFASCYQNAKEALLHGALDDDDWISSEERDKAIVENSVWEAYISPRNPVGSYTLRASSLTAILLYIQSEDPKSFN